MVKNIVTRDAHLLNVLAVPLQIPCVKSSFPHITAGGFFPQRYSVLIIYRAQFPPCIGLLDDWPQQCGILARK